MKAKIGQALKKQAEYLNGVISQKNKELDSKSRELKNISNKPGEKNSPNKELEKLSLYYKEEYDKISSKISSF